MQINGEDIKTKTQAQEIFLKSTGDISFLVARPPSHHDQYIDIEDSSEVEEVEAMEAAEEAQLLVCETHNLAPPEEDHSGISPNSKTSNR